MTSGDVCRVRSEHEQFFVLWSPSGHYFTISRMILGRQLSDLIVVVANGSKERPFLANLCLPEWQPTRGAVLCT